MNRRTFGKSIATMGAMFSSGTLLWAQSNKAEKISSSVSFTKNNVKVFTNAVEKTSKIMFIGDSHISYSEGLVDPYADYAKRMHNAFKNKSKMEALDVAFKKAEQQNYDLIILGGDIINFPSEYNIQKLKEVMEASKVPVKYISGNHDWHFEGSGVDIPQIEVRKHWIKKLVPLFFGEDYDCYKVEINGVKFLLVDDSDHDISKKQFEWTKRELSDGMPTVLAMHIPICIDGRNYDCANLSWGKATDKSYKIERRQIHPERQSDETFEFKNLIFNTPNVLGVLAGHTHKLAYDCIKGKFQAVCDRFADKHEYITLEICPKA